MKRVKEQSTSLTGCNAFYDSSWHRDRRLPLLSVIFVISHRRRLGYHTAVQALPKKVLTSLCSFFPHEQEVRHTKLACQDATCIFANVVVWSLARSLCTAPSRQRGHPALAAAGQRPGSRECTKDCLHLRMRMMHNNACAFEHNRLRNGAEASRGLRLRSVPARTLRDGLSHSQSQGEHD